MSNEFYEILRNPSRDYTDRYKNCDILLDKDTGEKLLSMRKVLTIPERPEDLYHRVEYHESTRLDMLAHKYYSNPLLWWVIAQANDIRNPFIPIAPGTLLRIPSLDALYGNNGILL